MIVTSMFLFTNRKKLIVMFFFLVCKIAKFWTNRPNPYVLPFLVAPKIKIVITLADVS